METISTILKRIKEEMYVIYKDSEGLSINKEKLSSASFIDKKKIKKIVKQERKIIRKCEKEIKNIKKNKTRIINILMNALRIAKQKNLNRDYVGIYYEFRGLFDLLDQVLPFLEEAEEILKKEKKYLNRPNAYKAYYAKEYGLSDKLNELLHNSIELNLDREVLTIKENRKYVSEIENHMRSKNLGNKVSLSIKGIAAIIILTTSIFFYTFKTEIPKSVQATSKKEVQKKVNSEQQVDKGEYSPLSERQVFDIGYVLVMKLEGNYSDDKHDPGGETYKGISERFYRQATGKEDVLSVKEKERRSLYYNQFWKIAGCDEYYMPALQIAVFQAAVNLGPDDGVRCLQNSLRRHNYNILADGAFGGQTRGALNDALKRGLGKSILRYFFEYQDIAYQEAIQKNADLKRYYRGWQNRIKRTMRFIEQNDLLSAKIYKPPE